MTDLIRLYGIGIDFSFEGALLSPVVSYWLTDGQEKYTYPVDMYKTPYDVPLLVLTTYTYMSFALVWLLHEAPVDFLNHTRKFNKSFEFVFLKNKFFLYVASNLSASWSTPSTDTLSNLMSPTCYRAECQVSK